MMMMGRPGTTLAVRFMNSETLATHQSGGEHPRGRQGEAEDAANAAAVMTSDLCRAFPSSTRTRDQAV